jgi:hypothetical protein
VKGNSDQYVVLRDNSIADPQSIYWKGLVFNDGARCKMDFCTIENASCDSTAAFTYSCFFTGASSAPNDSITFNYTTFTNSSSLFKNKRNSAIYINDAPTLSNLYLNKVDISSDFRLGVLINKSTPRSININYLNSSSDTMLYSNEVVPVLSVNKSNFKNYCSVYISSTKPIAQQEGALIDLRDNGFVNKVINENYNLDPVITLKNLYINQFNFINQKANSDTVSVDNLCFFSNCNVNIANLDGTHIINSHGVFKFENCPKINYIDIKNSWFRNINNQDYGILRIEGNKKDTVGVISFTNNVFDTISSFYEGPVLHIDKVKQVGSLNFKNNTLNQVDAKKKTDIKLLENGGICYLNEIEKTGNIVYEGNTLSQVKALSGGLLFIENCSAINKIQLTSNSFSNINTDSLGGIVSISSTETIGNFNSNQNTLSAITSGKGGAYALVTGTVGEIQVGGDNIISVKSNSDGGYLYVESGVVDKLVFGDEQTNSKVLSSSAKSAGGFAFIKSNCKSISFEKLNFDSCYAGGNGGVYAFDLQGKYPLPFRFTNITARVSGSGKSGGVAWMSFAENPDSVIIANNIIDQCYSQSDGGFVSLYFKGDTPLSAISLSGNTITTKSRSYRYGGMFNIESLKQLTITNIIEITDNNCNDLYTTKGGLLNSNFVISIPNGKFTASRNNITTSEANSGAFINFKLMGAGCSFEMNQNVIKSVRGKLESDCICELISNIKKVNVLDNSFTAQTGWSKNGFFQIKRNAGTEVINNLTISGNVLLNYKNSAGNNALNQISVPADTLFFTNNSIVSSDTLLGRILTVDEPGNTIHVAEIANNNIETKVYTKLNGGCYSINAKQIDNFRLLNDKVSKKIEANKGSYLNLTSNALGLVTIDSTTISGAMKSNATTGDHGAFINIGPIDQAVSSTIDTISLTGNTLTGGMEGIGNIYYNGADSTGVLIVQENTFDFSGNESHPMKGSCFAINKEIASVTFENNKFRSIFSDSTNLIDIAQNTTGTFIFSGNQIDDCSNTAKNGVLFNLDAKCNHLTFSGNKWQSNSANASLVKINEDRTQDSIFILNEKFGDNHLSASDSMSKTGGLLSIENSKYVTIKSLEVENSSNEIWGRALFFKSCSSINLKDLYLKNLQSYKYGVVVFDSVLNCSIGTSEFIENSCYRIPNTGLDLTYGGITLRRPTNVEINSCKFSGNMSEDNGGALSILNSDGYFVNVQNTQFNYNTSSSGAGIYCQNSNLTVKNTRFFANEIVDYGSGTSIEEGALYLNAIKSESYVCSIEDTRFEENSAPTYSAIVSHGYNKLSLFRNVFFNNFYSTNTGSHLLLKTGSSDGITSENDSILIYNTLLYYNSDSKKDYNDIGLTCDESDYLGIVNSTFYALNRTQGNNTKYIVHKSDDCSSKVKFRFLNSVNYKTIQSGLKNNDIGFNYAITNPNSFFNDTLAIIPNALANLTDKGSASEIYKDLYFPPSNGTALNDIGIFGGPYANWYDNWAVDFMHQIKTENSSLYAKAYQNQVLLTGSSKKYLNNENELISVKIEGIEPAFLHEFKWVLDPTIVIDRLYESADSISISVNSSKMGSGDTLAIQYINYNYVSPATLDWFKKGVGITEIHSNTLKAYPNPANQLVTIDGLAGMTANIRLVSISGTTIRQWMVKESESQSFDISDIPVGIYFIVAETKKTCTAIKLIIKR